jgi:hypothetical protein
MILQSIYGFIAGNLTMSDEEQVVLSDSLRPAPFSLGPWLYELFSLSLSFVVIGVLALTSSHVR